MLTRRTPIRAKTSLKRGNTRLRKKSPSKSKLDANKTKSKGYQVPKWFNKIPYGAHGNSPHTKRLWKVVSDTYREEDFNLSPYCPGCGVRFNHWSEGHLGHWLRYSLCKGWMKYDRTNLILICPGCNHKDDALTLKKMGEALQLRYGKDVLDYIEHTNNLAKPTRIEPWQAVDYVARLRPDLVV